MDAYRAWAAGRSAAELFFVYAAVFGVLLWAYGLATHTALNVPLFLVGCVVVGGVGTAVTVWVRKRVSGGSLAVQINTAIRTGELPPVIKPGVWLGKLGPMRAMSGQRNIATAVVFFIVGAGNAVLALVRTPINYGSLVVAAICLLGGAYYIVLSRREPPRILALENKIRATYKVRGS